MERRRTWGDGECGHEGKVKRVAGWREWWGRGVEGEGREKGLLVGRALFAKSQKECPIDNVCVFADRVQTLEQDVLQDRVRNAALDALMMGLHTIKKCSLPRFAGRRDLRLRSNHLLGVPGLCPRRLSPMSDGFECLRDRCDTSRRV